MVSAQATDKPVGCAGGHSCSNHWDQGPSVSPPDPSSNTALTRHWYTSPVGDTRSKDVAAAE